MNGKQWYSAHLRWAVMVEGKEGLRQWEEALHIFLSDDRKTAFQRALEIGHQAERSHDEGRRWAESRPAQVVKLDCLGANQTEFEVRLRSSRASERLPFEHVFDPEANEPEPPCLGTIGKSSNAGIPEGGANRFGPNFSRPMGSFRQGQNGRNEANTRWGQIRASKGAKSS